MRKLSLGFAWLFLLQLGVSAPQSSADPQRPSSADKHSKMQKSLSSMATPQAVGDEIVKFFGRKTGKELMMEKAKKGTGTRAAANQTASGKPSGRTATVVPLKPGYVPPPPIPRASVPQIRQEIQKILDLNKKIKNVQGGRAVQFQRVQEQARIHQRILNELEATQKQAGSQKPSAKNALLAQEKLRIIHEETLRNAQTINGPKEIPAAAVSKTVRNVKSVAS